MHIAILCISAVAICTERVEAKDHEDHETASETVAICTERVEAKQIRRNHQKLARLVAICTERVEAKIV